MLVPGLGSSNESFIDFLKAGILVLQAIGVRIRCLSREYVQLFETFLSVYYIFNEMKLNSSVYAELILLSKKLNKTCMNICVCSKGA